MSGDTQNGQCARRQTFRSLVALCFILLWLALPAAAQAGKRLILKDGSWQEIMEYEVHGDRARYFSTPRREWEEMPRALVDWKATEEWNARPMQMPPEEEEEPVSNELTVAPGLQLPTSGGVFLFDTFSGQPSLVELNQTPSVLNYNTSGIFHSAINPRVPFKQSLELKGLHARTRAHVPLPVFFVKIADSDQEQPIASTDRFRIVKVEPKKDSRTLANVDVTVTGKQSESQQFVPARIENFNEGWLKVIPLGDLSPGEYALVEMLDQSRFNSYAWDFGVDPHALGNLNALKPDSAASDETSTFSPELKPREK